MPGYSDPGFDTLALHAGAAPDPATGARAVPIHLTTSFVFESSDHAAALFNLERAGHVYSRISNPTNAVFEQRMAALEGGIGAIATASGQAALHLSIATLMGAGSHIVASTALYGGSQNLLHYTLRRFGIDTTFVKPRDIDGWRAAVRPNTKLFCSAKRVGNPGLDVLDIPTVSAIAHDAGVPLLVDSTFTTPWLMKPFDHGADLTLPLGHQVPVGPRHGDRRRAGRQRQAFDWEGPRSGRQFPELTEAYDGFHGMVFTEESTVGAFLLRARREGLRDFRRLHEPAHRLADPAGHRDAAAAHGAPHENTRKVVEFLAGAVRPSRRWATPMLEEPPQPCAGEGSCCRAAAAACSAST
jgi:O-acetylhomoserine (thiol)-lyase